MRETACYRVHGSGPRAPDLGSEIGLSRSSETVCEAARTPSAPPSPSWTRNCPSKGRSCDSGRGRPAPSPSRSAGSRSAATRPQPWSRGLSSWRSTHNILRREGSVLRRASFPCDLLQRSGQIAIPLVSQCASIAVRVVAFRRAKGRKTLSPSSQHARGKLA